MWVEPPRTQGYLSLNLILMKIKIRIVVQQQFMLVCQILKFHSICLESRIHSLGFCVPVACFIL